MSVLPSQLALQAALSGNSGEQNRGASRGVTHGSSGQPMTDVRCTWAKAVPILEPDAPAHVVPIVLPETPETRSPASSARNSACYGFTSVYVSTPESSPISTPPSLSRSRQLSSTPAAAIDIDNDNNNNNNNNSSSETRVSCSPSPPRSRRTRSSVSHRSRPELHAARLQRSATLSTPTSTPTRKDSIKESKKRRSLVSNASTDSAPEHPGSNLTKMDDKWIIVQQKTFTKWLNTKIEPRGVQVKDLVTDLSDGILLIHLLECLSNESLGRYAARPKLRVQKFENANIALNFVKSRGIAMINIGAEDVVDGNRKIILGLIWTLILRFTISDINAEGMTAKEGLLLWCQRKTACYDEVEVRDFSTSWNDGLAFCALLDIHRPDLIDYDALDKSDHRGNMQLAFDLAHKEIGIPALLDVEDVCDVARPDEKSLMTYIAYWFHAFSQMEKVENAGRRVEKFVNNMQGAWEMQSAYERRMTALLKQIREQIEQWQQATFEGTYIDAKQQASEFASHKKGKKRDWVAEKSDLATLLGNIKTKLGTYRLRAYEPPPELSLETMEVEWANLTKSEMMRGQLINETIRE
ncbi:hypothetical protein FHL15_007804 [Xylaria flabelliformis]|uniref:Calponin-homology (CH) domain-containing protein n=1 Tax=Xylaria flabelliformis TaxID=2512241 RepID=A0A553HTU7_9PEZI|nr:hypothetical protein FHL15_007804 [Xylaria flabelliformis]